MPPAKGKETSRGATSKKRGADEASPRSRKSARRESDQNKENSRPNGSDNPSKQGAASKNDAPSKTDKHSKTAKRNDHAPYEYVCVTRPQFDIDSEYRRKRAQGEIDPLGEDEMFDKLFKPINDEESKKKIFRASPKDHPTHKWVMMWSAWTSFCDMRLRVKYCDPDNFNMYIYNDFRGYGIQEILVEQLYSFDTTVRGLDLENGGLDKLWSIITAMGLWANVEGVQELINTDDGEGCKALIGVLGCALLTTLSAIEVAGELKPDSRFLDLALVISYYLELSSGLPAYGIEGQCVSWRKDAVKFFKKANLDPSKGLANTQLLLDKLENASNYYYLEFKDKDDEYNGVGTDEEDARDVAKCLHPKRGTEKDPWAWHFTFERWMKMHYHDQGRGFQHYDITKMTRAERARHAFDGKDPLKDIPVKDLQNNLLDFE